MLNPTEADTVEELAEIGVAFLELDLSGERCSILHGDEQHPRVVIQCFSGFSINELDLFDWLQWTWDDQLHKPGSCLLLEPAAFRGRYALLAGLHRADGTYLGFMHTDRQQPFTATDREKLSHFVGRYGQHLGSLVPLASADEARVPAQRELFTEDSSVLQPEWAWMDYV